MRLLGIDYGSRRVGIALSDESQQFALAHSVLASGKNLLAEIKKIVEQNSVERIIVGDSRDYQGAPNAIMKKVAPFVEELRALLKLPVEMEPEFMTSAEAVHLQGESKTLDASAAALILKSYIEKKAHKEMSENH